MGYCSLSGDRVVPGMHVNRGNRRIGLDLIRRLFSCFGSGDAAKVWAMVLI